MSEHKKLTGLIAERFLVPSQWHLHLIREAISQSNELTLAVCSTPADPVPGAKRYAWLKELFPGLQVLHLPGEEPFLPDDYPKYWLELIANRLPGQVDAVFSVEYRGDALARKLKARHITLRPQAEKAATSGEQILESPYDYWEHLPAPVRSFFVKKIVLTGPESVGKTSLAEQLAAHFNTVWVEEYGRAYTEKVGNDLTSLDFAHIAGGQMLLEDEAARKANQVLFCDTDLIVTETWGEIYLDHCPQWIIEMNHARRYEGFLLLTPDIAWEKDSIRFYGDRREQHFKRLQEELVSRNLRFAVISGNYEERLQRAVKVVNEWLFPCKK